MPVYVFFDDADGSFRWHTSEERLANARPGEVMRTVEAFDPHTTVLALVDGAVVRAPAPPKE